MPFIRMYIWSGKDQETKQKTAQAVVDAASEALGAPKSAFTVVFEEVDQADWDAEVEEGLIGQLRDKIAIENGELV